MKKLIAIAALMLSIGVSAFAQRMNVPYVSAGVITHVASGNFNDVGGDVAFGFRNYNRNSFISFGVGAEAFGYYIPSRTASALGAFAIPEIGVAIGPSVLQVYFHSGFMLGYDTMDKAFGWGGKEGVAFNVGRHVTIDFSTYVPKYNFHEALYAVNFIWRI